MRAWRFDALHSLDDLVLHREPVPTPQRGEVLVKVRAVSLNYRDVAPVLGRYVWDAKAGLVPCSDAAGEVAAVGEGVVGLSPGDRVIGAFHPRWFGGRPPRTLGLDTYGNGVDGWLADYKVVSQEALVRLPDGMSASPVMVSEDFSFMLGRVPGAYIHMGIGDAADLHNPAYAFNDAAIPFGSAFLASLLTAATH